MQANKRNLGEILSQDIRLVAPLFQRPYVWNEDDNWLPLWQAVSEVIDRRLNKEKSRPYFMGALVFDQVPNAIGSVQSREMIDGQQRMTTLQILFEVTKRIFAERQLAHESDVLVKLTRNMLDVDSDEQFKVWPTNIDRASFKAVMTKVPTTGLMQKAAEFFDSKITTWLSKDQAIAKEMAKAFIDAIRLDLVFVAIDLENEDDGQLIFETLNSLGTPLLPSDLVKNLLFRQAIVECLNTDKLYSDYWEPFERDSLYWRYEVRAGRRKGTRLDLFLQYFLTYSIIKEPALRHQFRDYRDSFKEGKWGNTEQALRIFTEYAHLFREFDEAQHGSSGGSLRHVLTTLDTTVPNPLILGIYANVQRGSERDEMLSIIESYLVRRMLMSATMKNLNRVTVELIAKLKRDGWTSQNLSSALISYQGSSTAWPTDNALIKRHHEKNAYGDIRGVGLALALSRVEQTMRSGKSELLWNTRTPLTIEHLMPQRWEQNWPLTSSDDPEATLMRKDLVNRLGNLTVLTQKLNSAVSNSSWAVKRQHLNDHSVLLMNSSLATKETWDENEILNRSTSLAVKFCELWPRPNSVPGPEIDFDDEYISP